MIIVQLNGGLGNQLFQYAFGWALAKKTGQNLKLDNSQYAKQSLRIYSLENFDLDVGFASEIEIKRMVGRVPERVLRKICNNNLLWSLVGSPKIIFEQSFESNVDALIHTGDGYFVGYWQSFKYFSDFQRQLRDKLWVNYQVSPILKQVSKDVERCNSVSLHVRRGDYAKNSEANKVHGVCELEYFNRAIDYIEENVKNAKYFIFTDDPVWVGEHLLDSKKMTLVSGDGETTDSDDMYLMSMCHHNIISNSTFSWWGAWLNDSPDKLVVAPENWFVDRSVVTNDLIPSEWVRV